MRQKQLIHQMGIILFFAISVTAIILPKIEGLDFGTLSKNYQAKPLPSGPDARLWVDFQELYSSVLTRELMTALEVVPFRGDIALPELTSVAERFALLVSANIEGVRHSYRYKIDLDPYHTMIAQLEGWFEKGIDHPALRYAHIVLLRQIRESQKCLKSARAGLDLCKGADDSVAWMRFEFLVEMSRLANPPNSRPVWRRRAKDAFPAAFHADKFNSGEERMMSYRVAYEFKAFFKDKESRDVADAVLADEQVPEFIKQLVDGCAHIDEAWEARGDGYSNTVSRKGFQGFKEHLDAARKALSASWEVHPELPEAPNKMISVAMGESIESNEERRWFDRAVAAQFDYAETYWKYYWALMPRWGGSIDEMLSFGREGIDSGRFDTTIPLQYFYILMDGIKEYDYELDLFHRDEVQEDLQRIAAGYLSDEGLDDYKTRGVVSFVAAVAVWGGNYAHAHQVLEAIDYRTNRCYTENRLGVIWEDYVASAFLQGSSISNQYFAAHKAVEDGSEEVADTLYGELIQTVNMPDTAFNKLQWERAGVELDIATSANGWKSVFTRSERVAWAGERCYWVLDPEGRLAASSTWSVGWLPGQVSIEDGFEIEFIVDHLEGPMMNGERASILFARPDWHEYWPMAVNLKFKDELVEIDKGCAQGKKSAPCLFEKSNVIRVVVHDRKMTILVNGEEVIRNEALSSQMRFSAPLNYGLGDYYSGRFKEKLRFHGIRIKNL